MQKTLGILGGGQLGRMIALAAPPLGIRTVVFTPETNSPASYVTNHTLIADYDDADALAEFARACDVITYEFENIPLQTVRSLNSLKPVYPSPAALAVTQDRVLEKSFINDCGLATAPWHVVTDETAIASAIEKLGLSLILKTIRLGYDGKGQRKINNADEARQALTELGAPLIAEGMVQFTRELSIIIARNQKGEMRTFPLVENVHRDHILYQTIAPAAATQAQQETAKRMAEILAQKLELVGILAIELFELEDGSLLVNELAPRPHNSGHWTIEGCYTSQFTQLVRALVGMPLGSADAHHAAVMTNLLGSEIEQLSIYAQQALTYMHDYGKTESKPGRKMGHVTQLKPLG